MKVSWVKRGAAALVVQITKRRLPLLAPNSISICKDVLISRAFYACLRVQVLEVETHDVERAGS